MGQPLTDIAHHNEAIAYVALVNRFNEAITEVYHEFARKKGLSDSAFNVLYALYEKDGQRQLELCKTSLMPKQTLASTLNRLSAQDIVRIENESRRVSRVFLTEKGKRQVEEVVAPLIQAEIAAASTLPPEMLQQLPEILDAYLNVLRKEFAAL